MKKFIIAVLTVLIVITSMFTAFAQDDTSAAEKLAFLKDLGIIAPNFERIYLPDSKITVGEMLSVMQNIMYDSKYGTYDDETAYNDAVASGFFGADKNARYYDNAKYEHVIEAAYNILGYGPIARQNNNYPFNYISMKETSTLIKGVDIKLGGYIPKKDFIEIIFNMFDAKALEIDKIGEDSLGFSYKDGEGVLKLYRNIETLEGIVEGTSYAKAYKTESDIAQNKVLINGELYDNGGIDFSDVIGLKIKAFVYEKNNGHKKIKSFIKDENILSFEIDGEDVQKYSVYERKLYYFNQIGKEKYVKISPEAVVLLNGCAVENYQNKTFLTKYGNIKLYDNDSDNIYDVVHINDYDTYYVDYVSLDADTVHNIYTVGNSKSTLDLEEKDNIKVIVYKDGKEADKSIIKKGDVLTVANGGTGGSKIIKVYVSDKSETGYISEYSKDDEEITFNKISYKLAKGYTDAVLANDSKAWQIKLGVPVEIYRDCFDKIAYIKPLGSEYIYGYALYTDRERYTEIRVLDEFSVWKTYQFADKVKLNAEADKCSEKEMYNKLGGDGFKPQLVKYKLDSENKIKEIYTANTVSMGAYDEFTISEEQTRVYQQSNLAFASKSYLEDGAVIWLLKKQTPESEEDITIMNTSELYSDRSYTYVQYNADEYGFSKYFAVYETSENKEFKTNRSGVMAIEKVFKTVDANGENKNAIRGMMFEYNNIMVPFSDDTDLNNIKPGDAVSFSTDSNGEITDLKVIHRKSESNVSILPSTIHTSVTYVGGILEKCDFASGRAKIICGSSTQVLKIDPATPAIVCEDARGDVILTKEQFTSADIGFYILARVQNSRVSNVIIYK